MKTFKIEITLKVADSWIADGFDASERLEEIEEQITSILPFAYGHELEVIAKLISAPSKAVIEALQSGELEIKN